VKNVAGTMVQLRDPLPSLANGSLYRLWNSGADNYSNDTAFIYNFVRNPVLKACTYMVEVILVDLHLLITPE